MTARTPPASTLIQCNRLDPRPADEAGARPIVDAVNIPLLDIPARTHELPPRDVTIDVIGPCELARDTVNWLSDNGRRGQLVDDADDARPDDPTRRLRLWRPNPWLEQILPEIEPGRVLEMACGTGRDAVHMASCGWTVTAIDLLPDALDRARALEERYGLVDRPVQWMQGDLERGEPPIGGTYDLITGFRFLHRPIFGHVRRWLNPGGHVIYETFTTLHRHRNSRPSREAFLLKPGELPTLLSDLTIRRFSEAWIGNSHVARVWATAIDVQVRE